MGALILVAIGAAFSTLSIDYCVLGEEARISPGFVPFIAGLLLVAFGAMIGWETWKSRVHVTTNPTGEDTGPETETDKQARHNTTKSVALIFGLLLIAVILSPILGFLLTFSILVFAILAVVEREHFWFSLVISLSIGLLAWLIFYQLMGIRLPLGIIAPLIGG
ncbi:tripartite tricarboxylate transporter TctB family protein [Modicisalibacter radicis]|uniref:tripartite tricarboxylate transporter TctB family protein n=1 Tax=Halomonas sp. EAR18 TaxID=2518972 RepID=UPI001443BF99|nr:tripartite tricarboxylate transporter TctB family protein [Halomonas sp. EAR18]